MADTAKNSPAPWRGNQNYPGRNEKISVFTGAPYPHNGPTHLDLFGEFLYWTSGYDLSYAIVGQDLSYIQRTLLTFDANYQPGLRIGIGYQLPKQRWDLMADWVYFHNTQNSTLHAGTDTIFLTWISKDNDSNPAQSPGGVQTSSWKLFYNEIGVEIGNPLYFSRFYGLRPNAALRYLKIQDGFEIAYTNTGNSEYNRIQMNNRLHGFGFSFGLDNEFCFGYGLSLLTNFKGALIYSSSHLLYHTNPSQASFGFLGASIKKTSHDLLPLLEGRMDLGWKRSFYCDKIALALTGGYEYRVLINGFTAIAAADIGGATAYPYQKANIFVHGMNIGAKISY